MSRRPSSQSRSGPGRDDASNRKGGDQKPWLWGVHPVLAALANKDRNCHRLILTKEAAKAHGDSLSLHLPLHPRLSPETVERSDIDALLPPGAVHQGIALLAQPLDILGVEDLIDMARGLDQAVIVILDQVTDPHNVGAVLRSAAAFGALGVLVPDRHAPSETGILAKSASGALETIPLARTTNLVRALELMKKGGFWIAGLTGDADKTLAEANLSGKIALALGAEGDGLRRLTRENCDYLVKLPQTDRVESLNVSNAAAVSLYELFRR